MANLEHVDILKQGVKVWNTWREKQSDILQPDLSGVRLSEAYLSGSYLSGSYLGKTYLSGANLSRVNLRGADLWKVDLEKANLSGADLNGANLWRANLSGANLSGANLSGANLTKTTMTNADLTGCSVFGVSVWEVRLEGAIQKDLIITESGKLEITVDNLEVAQFIYLLLKNSKIRDVIDTITSKVVLILGRFTNERKLVLDALRNELRTYNFSPVVFDFDPSAKRNLTETISLLANMSRFVIADLTDAKSIPQELERIVPHLPSVPVQPIIHIEATEYAMFEHYERYPWVLPIYRYQDISSLIASIKDHIIKPIEQKEYEKNKMKEIEEENLRLREEIKKLRRAK